MVRGRSPSQSVHSKRVQPRGDSAPAAPRGPGPSPNPAAAGHRPRGASAAPAVPSADRSIPTLRSSIQSPDGHYQGTLHKVPGIGRYTVDYTVPGEHHTRQILWKDVWHDALLGNVVAIPQLLQRLDDAGPASPLNLAWSQIKKGGKVPILFKYSKVRGVFNAQTRFVVSADLRLATMSQGRQRLNLKVGKQVVASLEGRGLPYTLDSKRVVGLERDGEKLVQSFFKAVNEGKEGEEATALLTQEGSLPVTATFLESNLCHLAVDRRRTNLQYGSNLISAEGFHLGADSSDIRRYQYRTVEG